MSLTEMDVCLMAWMANSTFTVETAHSAWDCSRASASNIFGLPAREGRLSSHPPMRLRYLEANLHYDPIIDGHYVG